MVCFGFLGQECAWSGRDLWGTSDPRDRQLICSHAMGTPLTSLGSVVPWATVNLYVLCTVLLPGFVKNQPQKGGGMVAPTAPGLLAGQGAGHPCR